MFRQRKRNTLLELLRLFAAFWIMYNHSYTLIPKGPYFDCSRFAVEFFFILSGFFFLKSFAKERDKGWFKGAISFAWKRFKPLAPAFFICLIFSIDNFIFNFTWPITTGLWNYLWYVPCVILTLTTYFILKRIFKNKYIFNAVVIAITAITLYFNLTFVSVNAYVRGFGTVGIGILLSQIPKLKFKHSNIFSLIMYILILAGITISAYFSSNKYIWGPIYVMILFPLIIYFASNVNVSIWPINLICSINFGLYAYQEVALVLRNYQVVTVPWQLALIVIAIAIADAIIFNLIRYLAVKFNK